MHNKIVILFLGALISQRLTVVLTSFVQDKAGQEIFDCVYLFPKVRSNSEIQIRFLSWKDIFPASVDAAQLLLVMMTSEKETHTIYTCLTVSNYYKKKPTENDPKKWYRSLCHVGTSERSSFDWAHPWDCRCLNSQITLCRLQETWCLISVLNNHRTTTEFSQIM